MERYYLPALFSNTGKIVTLSLAALLIILGWFGLQDLEMGLEPQLAAPTDYYLQVIHLEQFKPRSYEQQSRHTQGRPIGVKFAGPVRVSA